MAGAAQSLTSGALWTSVPLPSGALPGLLSSHTAAMSKASRCHYVVDLTNMVVSRGTVIACTEQADPVLQARC